jgi:hypothetical protein
MDVLTIILNVAEIVLTIIIGYFLYSHLPAYFKEKGKNLATKEDIKDITEKIESVRTDYAKQLLVYQLTYGKKFDILHEVWQKLIDLRRATQGLRPLWDYVDPNESEEERKKNRLKKFAESQRAFADAVEKNQPFYPKNIYTSLRKIAMIAHDEADEYSIQDSERRPLDQKIWANALENQQKILNAVDNVCEQIRKHIAA